MFSLYLLYTSDKTLYEEDENFCRSHFQATYLSHLKK
jgi:hypothetical protein